MATQVYCHQTIPRRHKITPGEIGMVYFACPKSTIFIRYERDDAGIKIMDIEFHHQDYKPWENNAYIGPAEHLLITEVTAAMMELAKKLKTFNNLITYRNQ
jgi:hypothetical protein